MPKFKVGEDRKYLYGTMGTVPILLDCVLLEQSPKEYLIKYTDPLSHKDVVHWVAEDEIS